MTYIVSEDAKITGKWIQLMSRSVDIMDVSQSVSVLNQTSVLFDIRSKYMMTTSHRRRIDKFHFLLLLKIEVVLYEFLRFLSFTYLPKLNRYISITQAAFSVQY